MEFMNTASPIDGQSAFLCAVRFEGYSTCNRGCKGMDNFQGEWVLHLHHSLRLDHRPRSRLRLSDNDGDVPNKPSEDYSRGHKETEEDEGDVEKRRVFVQHDQEHGGHRPPSNRRPQLRRAPRRPASMRC